MKIFKINDSKYDIHRIKSFLEEFPSEFKSFLEKEMSRFNKKTYKVEISISQQNISEKHLFFLIEIKINNKKYFLIGNGELKRYVRFFYFNNTEVFNQIENDFSLLKDSVTSIYHSFEQICALALVCKK